MQAEGAPATLMSDMQRGLAFLLAGMGLTFLAVGLFVPPRDALFWVAFCLLPLFVGTIGGIIGTTLGRRLDAWAISSGAPAETVPAQAAAALAEPERRALQVAALPAVLAELASARAGMQPEAKAAATRLLDAAVAAWNAAPDAAAREALARDLPKPVADLLADGPAAARAALDHAARLASAAGGAR